MGVRNIFSPLMIILLLCGAYGSFKEVCAQDKDTEDISESVESKTEDTGFFNFEYKVRIQEEAYYSKTRDDNLLNPGNDFQTDNNYYNRMILDLDSKLLMGKYFDINFHDQVAWKWREHERIGESAVDNYMQELFLIARISDFIVIDTGRENVISGSAYGWNPTDYMLSASISANPDPQTLREQRLGAYLVKAAVFFNSGQVSALYAPRIDNADTNELARQLYKFALHPYDNLLFEALFFRDKKNSAGTDLELSVTDDLILYFEGSATKGSDVMTVETIESYGDNYYGFEKREDKFYCKTVFGYNYTFTDMHNLVAEFYYNSEGYSKGEWEDYFSMLEYSGDRYNSTPYNIYLTAANSIFHPPAMSRYYLFLRLSKQNIFFDNLDYAVFSFINLYDGSMLLNLNPEYSFQDHIKSGIIYSYYLGKKKSEFGASGNLFSMLWYLGVYF